MRCNWILLLFFAAVGFLAGQRPATEPGPPPAILLPGAGHEEVLLWPDGAPGLEGHPGGERFRVLGDRLIITNVHRPSITPYLPPKGLATGAAVIVAPGGGFEDLWITHEGYRVADWLAQRGIAAFVLKYRLERQEASVYTTRGHALPDMLRAIRVVKERGEEWGVDPDRVGVMGFSAGGVLAGLAGTHYGADDKPAFQALIYGSPFDGLTAEEAKVTKETPPVFLLAGSDDEFAASYPDVYKMLSRAGVLAELHIYGGIPHGFGLQPDNPASVAGWLDRFRDWLFALGLLAAD